MSAIRDLAGRTDLLSLNTATIGHHRSLQEAVDTAARHGLGGIAPWREKLAETGIANAARLIRDAGLKVSGLCRAGLFPVADKQAALARADDNRRAVDEAAEIGAACVIVVAGGIAEGSRDIRGARNQVVAGITEMLEYANSVGVRLALEPLHPMYAADRACINTLSQALDICEMNDAPGLGVAIDVYHVWWDPMVDGQISRAGNGHRIYAFHISDWLRETRHMLLDRGMMGDGVIDIHRLRCLADAVGYEGMLEAEIFSEADWWKREPDEIVKACVERFQSCC